MKKSFLKFAVAVGLALSMVGAYAQDWIRPEVGAGYTWSKDMGDGIWIQQGAQNNQDQKNAPAFLVGVTGRLYTRGDWSVDYHADYVYFGQQSASVLGVPDANYNPVTHTVHDMQPGQAWTQFNGFGHLQGIPITLDAGYTYDGYRMSAEAGYWLYWQTWRETVQTFTSDGTVDGALRRNAHMQAGYVVGARVEKGPLSVSYRYYNVRPDWSDNQCPGLVTGTQMLMLTYKF